MASMIAPTSWRADLRIGNQASYRSKLWPAWSQYDATTEVSD
jgi:hypothetical protein